MNHVERRAALAVATHDGDRPGQLAKACLLIARGEYPHLDPDGPREELRLLSTDLRDALEHDASSPWQSLAELLAGREGFAGDRETYDDPHNSYVNDVLERRRGLPILLSVVWVEVARGAGLVADGVALPGHFIASVGTGDRRRLVDPFSGGRLLSADEALRIGVAAVGDERDPDPAWLAPAAPASIVLRVLENLAGTYARRGDSERLERVVSDQIALEPGDAKLLVRRADARLDLGDRDGGLDDLNGALARAAPGRFFEQLRERARLLARLTVSEN